MGESFVGKLCGTFRVKKDFRIGQKVKHVERDYEDLTIKDEPRESWSASHWGVSWPCTFKMDDGNRCYLLVAEDKLIPLAGA